MTINRTKTQRYSALLSLPLFVLLLASSASAQSISPELYNGLKWRLIGPFRGGRVAAVAGVPANGTTFYFGAVNGGVWKTTDAGMVWTPIFDGQLIASIGALAIAPSDPKIIYAGTGESDIRSDLSSGDGVYKSTDGGQTWKNIGLRETRQISRIVIDPHDANIVYVGALGHAYGPNEDRGVFKSTDGGTSWKKVLDEGSEIGIADLAIAAENPNILYATTWKTHRPPWSTYAPIDGPGGGLFRSQDGGESWIRLTGNGLPDGDWGRTGVAVSANGKRVYAIIATKKSGLYRSDDSGNTWQLINEDHRLTSRAWYFGGVTIDPSNPDVFYLPNVALYRSEDGGKTISIVRGAPGGDDYHQLWVDPRDSSRMILGTDQGATISLDYGKTWSSWYNQPTAQIYHVAADNKFPYTVYGTQQDSGAIAVLSRTDHGQITARDCFPGGGSESGYMALDPNQPNIVYLSSTYGGVSRFDMRTSFSQDITPWPVRSFTTEINLRKYRDPWTPVLLFSPADHQTLYLGTQYVMKTIDGGLHWEVISPDLTGAQSSGQKNSHGPTTTENAKQRGYGVVYSIAPSPLNPSLIWAGTDTGLIHLSRDGGKTWNDVTPEGLTGWSRISFIEASHFNAGEAYAAADRHRLDDQEPYLFRTRDYGVSWQTITSGIAEASFVRVVREDPGSKGLLFAGTERGIYVSFDDGDHWQPLQLNLPVTSIHDLIIHGDDLVVATHGRSFWILDDITALRQLNDAGATSAWLYRPATAVRVDNDPFQGTPLPPEEPAASNPPNGAILDYFLRLPATHVSLEIFDDKQELVHRFSSDDPKESKGQPVPIAERWFPARESVETTPGMHRFTWNLAWGNSAGKDSMQTEDSQSLRGPRAKPGTYQVRFTVDGKSWSQPLTIGMDPRSSATPGELDRQLDLGRHIFSDCIQAQRWISEVNSVRKQLSQLQQQLNTRQADLKSSLSLLDGQIDKILGGDQESTIHIGLEAASNGLSSALRVVEDSDREIPSQAMAVYQESKDAMGYQISRWNDVKMHLLPQLNRQLREKKLAQINL